MANKLLFHETNLKKKTHTRTGRHSRKISFKKLSSDVSHVNMVATGQEIVREKKNSSRSGKSQGISL